jgi:hypothetical protein
LRDKNEIAELELDISQNAFDIGRHFRGGTSVIDLKKRK